MTGVGVVGSGNTGRALAAYLSSRGHSVTICTRDPERIDGVRRRKAIEADGYLTGEFPVDGVTADPGHLAGRCPVIFVAGVTTAYADVARALAPHLDGRHLVVLFSSKLCGSLEFSQVLGQYGATGAEVMETDALFACRARGDHAISISGMKQWNLFACPRPETAQRYGSMLTGLFPGLERATNLIHRGLTDFGALAHAIIAIANLSKIDRAEPVRFYYEGLSERTVVLLERMEREFRAVAGAYRAELLPADEVLYRYYGCKTGSVLDAMRTVIAYENIWAPTTLDHRFLREDVASTLVPLRGLARKAGVATPMVDAVISLASAISGEDFEVTGRTLRRIGLEGLTQRQILDRLHR